MNTRCYCTRCSINFANLPLLAEQRAALRLVFYFGMDTGVVVHRLALGFGAAALGRLALWLPKWGMYEGRALVEMLVSCLYPKAVDDSVTVTVTLTAILIFTLT